MCLGIPGKVVELTARPDISRVDVEGVVRDINMGLLEDDPPQPGQWIMIHLGFALQRMTEQEARDALDVMSVLGEGELPEMFTDGSWGDDDYAPKGYREAS